MIKFDVVLALVPAQVAIALVMLCLCLCLSLHSRGHTCTFLHTNVVYAEACKTSSSTRLPLPKLTNMLLSGGFWRISTIGHQIGNWQSATDWPTDLCGREGVEKSQQLLLQIPKTRNRTFRLKLKMLMQRWQVQMMRQRDLWMVKLLKVEL